MTTLFISDLHIDASTPEITRQFVSLLHGEARQAEALYILGDLFESWVGDDAADADQIAAIAALKQLTDSGVPCFVMHGNRDFLLGPQFCAMSGAQILFDPLIVTLYGEAVLVMHGDALCTDDRAYQRLRATVRDAGWQRQFLALSIAARRALAGAARVGSQAHTATLEYTIADVNPSSVSAALRNSDAATLLHGHTHRPGIHAISIDGRACTRIVLGDWHARGSLLRWDRGGPELVSLERVSAQPHPSGSGIPRRAR
ncbi:MAG: UDP-2,3-diacylglucosamine diphosphatase [Pseudomonadota bacterium]|nr:UDP-2,3-diacylglucosamine diphosphatase [Pseudomonadota bacterium]